MLECTPMDPSTLNCTVCSASLAGKMVFRGFDLSFCSERCRSNMVLALKLREQQMQASRVFAELDTGSSHSEERREGEGSPPPVDFGSL